jgi:hypothetical protein
MTSCASYNKYPNFYERVYDKTKESVEMEQNRAFVPTKTFIDEKNPSKGVVLNPDYVRLVVNLREECQILPSDPLTKPFYDTRDFGIGVGIGAAGILLWIAIEALKAMNK